MSKTQLNLFRCPDQTVLNCINELIERLEMKPGSIVVVYSLGGLVKSNTVNMDQFKANVELLRDINGTLIQSIELINFSIKELRIIFRRNQHPNADSLELNLTNSNDVNEKQAINICKSVFEAFRAHEISSGIEHILGNELSRFYAKREETLLQLEALNEKLIRSGEEFRLRLEDKFDKKQIELEQAFVQKEMDLLKKFKNQEQDLNDKHEATRKALEEKEMELEKRLKDVDDRSSKHVRRELRQDLKKILADRNKNFLLTKDTISKRKPVEISYLAAIVMLLAFSIWSVYDHRGTSGLDGFYKIIRTIAGVGTTIAMVVFYIRWNDQWFRQHANEEFRLKRLDLDIDRASWVVEMASEWREERENEIPNQLLDVLTRNLFTDPDKASFVAHPAEDLVSTILGPASMMKLGPNGVELTMDRKSVGEYDKSRSG